MHIKTFEENLNTEGDCKCIKAIKFKNRLNYFKNLDYKYKIQKNSVKVSYDDGRFTNMSKDIFDEHFLNI